MTGDDDGDGVPSTPAPRPKAAPKPPRVMPVDADGQKTMGVIKYTAEQLGDIESAYLRKQRELRVPLRFTFLNGKEYIGVVTDFTPFTIHIEDTENNETVILRKLALAYYRKADALNRPLGDARPLGSPASTANVTQPDEAYDVSDDDESDETDGNETEETNTGDTPESEAKS